MSASTVVLILIYAAIAVFMYRVLKRPDSRWP